MALTNAIVAPRYGRALFEVAEAQSITDTVQSELNAIDDVLQANPTLISALSAANLSVEAKQQMIQTLMTGASPLVQNLIQMLFDYGRIEALPAVSADFAARVAAAQGVVSATVVTAVELTADQAASLSQAIAAKFGVKTAVLTQQVDPSVLGGVKVISNHRIIDGTVATRLAKVRALLTK
ncbi:ATP synthase F1 subunit delta [Lacticaseibacillus saniviri]|uniref:ATP synthase subunit delta n=1 Tax=Lacticaseibacillus saniviri JCM 17471 = DSM 24301 TaxID=1293598 RepID=A0A0R2MVS6_9LACO|nr:ATP synthase F1 subunit delta [Lacticaseibacillus saniviri]KRO17622.1 F0F1-type ATP synthase, delta subunit [Lacticaseibacillus saniviri JCM 17471 = DSM 24301]MCG4282832.1 F0F1 ATP synthase subunit delta [Lacticaseibacillus saniviri]